MQIFGPKIVQNWFWWLPESPLCNAVNTNKMSFWCPELNFGPKYVFFGPKGANLGPNMADNWFADQLIGLVGLGARLYLATIYSIYFYLPCIYYDLNRVLNDVSDV